MAPPYGFYGFNPYMMGANPHQAGPTNPSQASAVQAAPISSPLPTAAVPPATPALAPPATGSQPQSPAVLGAAQQQAALAPQFQAQQAAMAQLVAAAAAGYPGYWPFAVPQAAVPGGASDAPPNVPAATPILPMAHLAQAAAMEMERAEHEQKAVTDVAGNGQADGSAQQANRPPNPQVQPNNPFAAYPYPFYPYHPGFPLAMPGYPGFPPQQQPQQTYNPDHHLHPSQFSYNHPLFPSHLNHTSSSGNNTSSSNNTPASLSEPNSSASNSNQPSRQPTPAIPAPSQSQLHPSSSTQHLQQLEQIHLNQQQSLQPVPQTPAGSMPSTISSTIGSTAVSALQAGSEASLSASMTGTHPLYIDPMSSLRSTADMQLSTDQEILSASQGQASQTASALDRDITTSSLLGSVPLFQSQPPLSQPSQTLSQSVMGQSPSTATTLSASGAGAEHDLGLLQHQQQQQQALEEDSTPVHRELPLQSQHPSLHPRSTTQVQQFPILNNSSSNSTPSTSSIADPHMQAGLQGGIITAGTDRIEEDSSFHGMPPQSHPLGQAPTSHVLPARPPSGGSKLRKGSGYWHGPGHWSPMNHSHGSSSSLSSLSHGHHVGSHHGHHSTSLAEELFRHAHDTSHGSHHHSRSHRHAYSPYPHSAASSRQHSPDLSPRSPENGRIDYPSDEEMHALPTNAYGYSGQRSHLSAQPEWTPSTSPVLGPLRGMSLRGASRPSSPIHLPSLRYSMGEQSGVKSTSPHQSPDDTPMSAPGSTASASASAHHSHTLPSHHSHYIQQHRMAGRNQPYSTSRASSRHGSPEHHGANGGHQSHGSSRTSSTTGTPLHPLTPSTTGGADYTATKMPHHKNVPAHEMHLPHLNALSLPSFPAGGSYFPGGSSRSNPSSRAQSPEEMLLSSSAGSFGRPSYAPSQLNNTSPKLHALTRAGTSHGGSKPPSPALSHRAYAPGITQTLNEQH